MSQHVEIYRVQNEVGEGFYTASNDCVYPHERVYSKFHPNPQYDGLPDFNTFHKFGFSSLEQARDWLMHLPESLGRIHEAGFKLYKITISLDKESETPNIQYGGKQLVFNEDAVISIEESNHSLLDLCRKNNCLQNREDGVKIKRKRKKKVVHGKFTETSFIFKETEKMQYKSVIEYKGGMICVQSYLGGTEEVTYQVTPLSHKKKASSVSVAKCQITKGLKNIKTKRVF